MNSKTQKTITPKLRFPEFQGSDSWYIPSLSEISERITKKVGGKSLETVSITAGVGFVTQAEKFSRDISGKQYKNYIILNEGEFSYNKGNSKKFPQGCIYQLKEFKQVAVPNAFISFRLNKGHIANFYQGYFDSNYHGKQLARFITSGARGDGLLNINAYDFFSIKFPTPNDLEEQQKVAGCLSTIDEVIDFERQKLSILRAHKKGLMQNLFPAEDKMLPKFRFPEFGASPDWGKKPLRGLADRVTTKNKGSEISRVLTNSAINGIVDQRDYFNKDIANQANLEGYSVVDKGDYVYNPRTSVSAPVGPISKNKCGAGVMSPLYTVFRFKSDINNFFEHYFKSSYWHSYLYKIANAGARHDRMSITNDSFMEMPLPYPPTEKEQQKIADCLSSADGMITTQEQKIEALKDHKKGLMQQLFPKHEELT